MHSILISGAAQGIGAAIARLFYQQGYSVGIYDIQSRTSAAIGRPMGERAKAGLLDVADYASWQAALSDFCQWAGELNILVNNAGILYSGAFENTHRSASSNYGGECQWCVERLSCGIALFKTRQVLHG